MKNLFTLITLISFLVFSNTSAFSQDNDSISTESVEIDSVDNEEINQVENVVSEVAETVSFHQIIKQKFIEGGPGFMGIVLLCLILGLALAIERIIYLNMATTDTDKLLNDVESAINKGGLDAAKEVCRNTNGPVA